MEQIRGLHPTVDQDEYRSRLDEITALPADWQAGDDRVIREKLSGLSNDLDRMHRLKTGISSFPIEIETPLKELVEALRKVGVFLAPVGELEQWLTPEEVATSRVKKAAWASAAAEYIQSAGHTSGGIWDFVRDVGQHLDQRRRANP